MGNRGPRTGKARETVQALIVGMHSERDCGLQKDTCSFRLMQPVCCIPSSAEKRLLLLVLVFGLVMFFQEIFSVFISLFPPDGMNMVGCPPRAAVVIKFYQKRRSV